MPCGVPTPLRGKPEAIRPEFSSPLKNWRIKKKKKKKKVSANIWYTSSAGDTTLDLFFYIYFGFTS